MPYLVDFPLCTYCGSNDAHHCRICDEKVCWDCTTVVVSDMGDMCSHAKYNRIEDDSWNFDLRKQMDRKE